MSSNVDAIIKQADWDVSKLRDKRCRDIEVQAGSISNEKLSELIAKYEVTYLGFYGSHGYLASSSLMLLLKGISVLSKVYQTFSLCIKSLN